MSDLFHNGTITSVSRLGDRPLDELEDDLRAFTARTRVALILPALYSEFEGTAMPRILRQLRRADYLARIILSLDGATEEQFRAVQRQMRSLPVPTQVIWNDGLRVRGILETLGDAGFVVTPQGKGRGVWLALGLALSDPEIDVVALHDCDIVNYRREMLARLLYPLVHPEMDFEFAKGYYARFTRRLYGRVTRLFFTPLIRSLSHLVGDDDFLRFLDSFRYALAGEFALKTRLARRLRLAATWGLEVSVLAEVYRYCRPRAVCQVELAESYEHKHQRLSKAQPDAGLHRMAGEIATSLFRKLAEGGVRLDENQMRVLPDLYLDRAGMAVDQFHALASVNGLEYDRFQEVETAQTFYRALVRSQRVYATRGSERVSLGSWQQVEAALPGLKERLAHAVTADHPVLTAVPPIPASPVSKFGEGVAV